MQKELQKTFIIYMLSVGTIAIITRRSRKCVLGINMISTKEQHLAKKRARIQSVSLVSAAAMLASLLYWLINA